MSLLSYYVKGYIVSLPLLRTLLLLFFTAIITFKKKLYTLTCA